MLANLPAQEDSRASSLLQLDYVVPWDQAREGRECQFEYTGIVDGRARVFSASLVPLGDEDGQVTKLLGYSRDITAQRTSGRQLMHRAEYDSHTLRIGASTGIAIYPGGGDGVSSLLQHADAQMYRVKRVGGPLAGAIPVSGSRKHAR